MLKLTCLRGFDCFILAPPLYSKYIVCYIFTIYQLAENVKKKAHRFFLCAFLLFSEDLIQSLQHILSFEGLI